MWLNPFLVLLGLLIAQGCVAISGVVVNNHLVETNQKRNRIQFPTPLINNHLMAKFAEYMQQAATKAPKGEISEVDNHREYNRLLKFYPNQGLLPFRNFNEYIITKNNFEQQLTTAFPTVGTNNYFDYLINLQNQHKNKPSYSFNEEYQYPPEQQYEDPVYYQRNKTMEKIFPLITSLNNHYLHQPITLSSASIEDAMEDPNEVYNDLYPATTPLNEAYVEIPKRRPFTMAPTRPPTLFGFPTTIYTPTNYPTATKSPSVTILSKPSHSTSTQNPPFQHFSTTTVEPVLITIQTNHSQSTISPVATQTSNTLSVITVTPSPRPKKKKKKKKKPNPTISTTESTIQKANVRPKLPTTTTKAPIRIFHNYFIMNCSVLGKDTEKLKELLNKQSALVAGVTITESPDLDTTISDEYYNPKPTTIQLLPQNFKKYVATPAPVDDSSSGSYKKTKKVTKPKKKVIYVDPPGVGEIKNVMDSVYGMMEDVFTDDKVVMDYSDEDARELRTVADKSTDFNLPEEKGNAMKQRLSNTLLKRKYRVGSADSTQYYDDGTILSDQDENEPLQDEEPQDFLQQHLPEKDIVVGYDSEELVSAEPPQEVVEEPVLNYSTSTRRPIIYKVTPAGGSRQSKESKEAFTTKIHVTSEYTPPTKATTTPLRAPVRRKNSGSDEDSGSEEYDYDESDSGSEEESGEDRSESEERDYDENDDESGEDSYIDSNSSESGDSYEELEEKTESLGLEDYNSIQFEYDNDDSSSEDATVFEFPDSDESPDYLAKSKNPSGDLSNDTQTNTTNVEALRKNMRKIDKKKKKKEKKCKKEKKPKGKKNKKKKKKSKKPKRRKKKRQPEPPKDSLEEYEDEYASDFFGFMAEFFTTIGRYVPFFGPSKKPVPEEEEEEEEARGTTPRIESIRKPKKPSYSSEKFYDLTNVEGDGQPNEEKQATPWYYPSFIYYNDYENEIPATTTEQGWLDSWFSWNSWFDDPEPVDTTIEAPVDEPWFPNLNLFGGATTSSTTTTSTTTTTTPQPPPINIPFLTVSNPIKNPEKWLSILAQQLKVSTTTVSSMPEMEENVPPKPVKVYYDNYQLWRLNPRTREHVDYLDEYRRSPEGQKFKWWRGPSLRGATDVLVPPSLVQTFKDFLDDESITQEVVIRDLQKVIEYENPRITKREQIETEAVQGHPMTFYRYHRYADMLKYLDFIQRKFSKNVELIHIGRSYEGRPLIVVKLMFPSSPDDPEPRVKNYRKGNKRKEKRSEKPAVFIEAGAHAREWISPASSLWIVDKLLRVIDNNETAEMDALKAVDWFIMPLLNPDGYEFSYEYDRMWTKTRSLYSDKPTGIISTALNWLPLSKESEPRCFGVNLNRNWDINWNQGTSASSFECSDNYSGPKAFSESESKSLSKWLMEHRKEIKIYISLHSYGQLITYPSSDQNDGYQQDELFDMAKMAVEALRATGNPSRYIIDNSNELLYPHSSGAADAFAMQQIGIKYSFTLEMRDTGTHGFLLPSSYIESSAQEVYEIIKGMIDYI